MTQYKVILSDARGTEIAVEVKAATMVDARLGAMDAAKTWGDGFTIVSVETSPDLPVRTYKIRDGVLDPNSMKES